MAGHAPSTIHRIWRAFGLQPHRSETFKSPAIPSSSSRCVTVGLSLLPPARALVLCVDEKSQIQALSAAAAAHEPERRSHDLFRHRERDGHRALLAASPRPEFLTFLRTIESHVRPISMSIWAGQLCDPQDSGGPPLVRPASPLVPLHPDRGLVAEPSGALLRTEKQLRRGVHAPPKNSNRPSSATLTPSTTIPSPSGGQSPPDILATIKRGCLRTLEIADQQNQIIKT